MPTRFLFLDWESLVHEYFNSDSELPFITALFFLPRLGVLPYLDTAVKVTSILERDYPGYGTEDIDDLVDIIELAVLTDRVAHRSHSDWMTLTQLSALTNQFGYKPMTGNGPKEVVAVMIMSLNPELRARFRQVTN